MKTPDFTLEQLLAAIAGAVGILVSLAVIDNETAKGIVSATSSVVTGGFMLWHMATVRGNRAKAVAAGAKSVDGKLVPPQ